ncbi:hypothetical protein Patl1_04193 [Pistacia atlantica]|uniref:Uncharacterized protein n=1 Tax=Pistacia atlantica TaxID=434234 RepID=A0ACC1BSQ3_9ROSI|nr:hypothetical protein Patl1_04193 [Pistacia atlantica]
MSTRFSMGEDRCVHAKAKKIETELGHISEPSMEIYCVGFDAIQRKLPLYIENDEQSINQKEEEINTET